MNREDYKKFKVIMGEACDAMIEARERQKRGDIEGWDKLSQRAVDLHDVAMKLVEQNQLDEK